MTTLAELNVEKVLRVGDEARYYPFLEGTEGIRIKPEMTGIEFEQKLTVPRRDLYGIRTIYPDGSIDIVPRQDSFLIAFGGETGFVKAEQTLDYVCQLYDNFLIEAHARCYSMEDLQQDVEDATHMEAEEVRVAFYPRTTFHKGSTEKEVERKGKSYFKDYSVTERHSFYAFDGGGRGWLDHDEMPYRVASRKKPVYVTGISERKHGYLMGKIKNFWLPEKGTLIERGEPTGRPTAILEYLCYIDRNGCLEYEYFDRHKITEARFVHPIIHIEPHAKVEDVYIGYQSDRRICEFVHRH